MPDRFAPVRHGPQAKPVVPAARHARLAAVVAGAVLAGAILTACSTSSDSSFTLFADPGKYLYHSCAQLAVERKNWSNKEQELKVLMDRADQSAGGAAVGFIAYKADYVAAGEELELLRSAARSKKCEQDEAWRSSSAIR